MKFDFDKVDKKNKDKVKGKIVLSSPRMSDVRAAQKNAKIAGVEKLIDFTRQDVEWLDIKFKKGSVDCIVSNIPCPSGNMSESDIKRIYDDLFYQIKYVLSKKGRAVFLGKNLAYLKSLAKDVKLIEEIQFMNGKETMDIIVFEKK
jgi:23S rRNA G2445 N2-methylase RlmL